MFQVSQDLFRKYTIQFETYHIYIYIYPNTLRVNKKFIMFSFFLLVKKKKTKQKSSMIYSRLFLALYQSPLEHKWNDNDLSLRSSTANNPQTLRAAAPIINVQFYCLIYSACSHLKMFCSKDITFIIEFYVSIIPCQGKGKVKVI